MDNNLTEVLMPIGVLSTIAAGIGYIIKTITDYSLKKRLVEKNLVNAEAQNLFANERNGKYGSLKWGLIVFFGGVALIVINYLDFHRDSALPFGIVAVGVSFGFLCYFFLMNRRSE